jgi:integrase
MAFEDAIAVFVAEKTQKNRVHTIVENERILRIYFVPLHRKNLADITVQDTTRILDKLSDTPGAALHAIWTLRTFPRWRFKRDYIDRNPIEKLDPPSKIVLRARVLSDDELRTVWLAADALGGHFSVIVNLLILTGQRRREIGSLRADRCSLPSSKDGDSSYCPPRLAVGGEDTQASICLPSTLTKNGRIHTFPIGQLSASILKTIGMKSG